MSADTLGLYNLHLSRPKIFEFTRMVRAINCTELSEPVVHYLRESLSENTRRAYLSDIAHFESWGGNIPATDELIASYIAAHAETLSVATLVRRIASLSKAHRSRGLPTPTSSELVKSVLRGIKRKKGVAHKEAKPLLRDDLFLVLDAMGDGLKDIRDKALLLIGFAGGFRRSELVAIDREDVQSVRQGIIIHIRRSKTDQEGAGRKIGIPHGRTRYCPVMALERWLELSGITDGPVFRPVDRHARIRVQRLSGEAIALVVKDRVSAAGMDPTSHSGHSLRSGLATSAAQAGVSSWKIRQQTGHASDAMLARYIRDGELFTENAVSALL